MADKNKAILDATFQIMEQLLETDNVSDILSKGLDIIASLTKCEAAVVWIADKNAERLYPMFHTGPSDITNVSVPVGTNTEGKCVFGGEAVIINDTSASPDFEGTVFDSVSFHSRSVMCIPLKTPEKTFGCFQLINKPGTYGFNADEQLLCQRIAALAALSIDELGIQQDFAPQKKVLLSLKDITKEFPSGEGTIQILKGINLDIYENELVVILGESGCGKSTLLNIIGGMDQLTSGAMLFDGKDYSHLAEKELTDYRRNEIGFVFQSYNLMPNLTAKENLEFIAEIVDFPLDPTDALEMMGMLGKADNYPSQLSGGQQQRIAIARALVKAPRLILADEPTAALDLKTSLDVLEAIQNIVRSKAATVVMVTHNAEIAKISDRVIRLRGGKIASIRANSSPLSARELVW